jgi:hypothetical protein
MVEKPVVLQLVWTFVPDALLQPLQNLMVKLSIDGLTRGVNSLWTVPWMSEKVINMDLTLLQTLGAFFGCSEFGDFHCDNCCLVSRS